MNRALIPIVALAVALAIITPRRSFAAGGDGPSGSCNVTSGGIGSGNNTANCNFGLTPEQFKQLTDSVVKGAAEAVGKGATEAAVKAAIEEQRERIDKISKTLGVTQDAAKTLLKIVGEDPNIPEDKLADALNKAAADYQRLQARVAALNPDNPKARALLKQAKSELDAGYFQHGQELLRQATLAQIVAAQAAENLEQLTHEARDTQMLGAAQSTAAEGDVAMTERRYREAAELFRQAAEYVPGGHAHEKGGYLLRQANALYRQGDERGDNDALRSSIEVLERALAEYPRSEAPLDWAETQADLGNVLWRLGEREGGAARLDEAVAAFRAALEEETREHLEAAVAAYRAALEENTRERVPLQWAATQNNLGAALKSLGERERGTARLEEAVAAYRAALEERTRDRVPLQWAATQVNLGNALEMLGERESGTARLEEAVATYRASLEETTRDRVPLQWAATQNNIGNALAKLGQRQSGTVSLEEAVAACREALEELTRERVPAWWASTHDSLGDALEALGERERGTARLEEAVAAYRAALEQRTRDRVPLRWAKSFGNQGVAMMAIADRTNNAAMAETAVQQIETAYETERSGGQEHGAAEFQAQLTKAQAIRPAQGQVRAGRPRTES